MSRKSLQWFGKQRKPRKSLVAKVRRIRGEPNEQFLTQRSRKKKKGLACNEGDSAFPAESPNDGSESGRQAGPRHVSAIVYGPPGKFLSVNTCEKGRRSHFLALVNNNGW
jgi:hypothetical protein